MKDRDSTNTFDDQAAAFWQSLEGVRADARLEHYVAFSRDAVRQAERGVVSRRQVGAALAPGWHDKAISGSGDMTMVTDLAGQISHGGFESREEADDVWEQMRGILAKYW